MLSGRGPGSPSNYSYRSVIHEVKVPSTPADIKTALAEAPACRRVVFETGRMAPMLHHGLTGCGVPVICIESRQPVRR
jgi:transposase